MASSLSISMTQENTTHLQIRRGMGLVQDVGGGGSGICYTAYSIVVVLKVTSAWYSSCYQRV